MKSTTLRISLAKGCLGTLLFAAACCLGGCDKPSNDVVKQGITASAQIELMHENPFDATAKMEVVSYAITNSYRQGEIRVYDYKAQVHMTDAKGQDRAATLNVVGTVGFQKNGDRWDFQPF